MVWLLVLQDALSLTQQLEYFKEYQNKVTEFAGKTNASSIISGAIYLVSVGSNDFVQNYYINPLLYKKYTVHQFANILITSYINFIEVWLPIKIINQFDLSNSFISNAVINCRNIYTNIVSSNI